MVNLGDTRTPEVSAERILRVICKFGKPDYKDGGTNIHESDYIKIAEAIVKELSHE